MWYDHSWWHSAHRIPTLMPSRCSVVVAMYGMPDAEAHSGHAIGKIRREIKEFDMGVQT
jgi:hypothetical protein